MKSGIYHVHFRGGPAQNFGDGIVVFKDGAINGGDVGYIYRGEFRTETNRIIATINAKRWNVVPNALINLNEFNLHIDAPAPIDDSRFSITAQLEGQPHLNISVTGEWLGEAS